ncbi:MAG: hypothetical protein GFH27_549307n179 [Chloroflexi bacterium AL-W]|nr:hypothetical protein [Chloroflexi bacterium AL-N1]NOK69211.1 hypothetical protein [Chloroflexi bacterium AL-N10]NOK77194.1 hypothetical protein [Chloroflexi bacterium AL-N5]NOK83839.1 hypothetical protein [Chloroflexi bacterium AL-W]NOK91049.1 hypothetical protein [Chloroflexi bacterium AL-N15]
MWEEAQLIESPLAPNRAIKARCARCHAQDGRDLKYFNYSKWSIVARSQFHGLSEKQGQQIASYIRSMFLTLDVRGILHINLAQGWIANLCRCGQRELVSMWYLSEMQMLAYVFPDGTTPQAIHQVADTKGTLNIREIPVAMQFPDCNAWLPEVHPLDLWGDIFVGGVNGPSPQQAYLETQQEFEEKGVE